MNKLNDDTKKIIMEAKKTREYKIKVAQADYGWDLIKKLGLKVGDIIITEFEKTIPIKRRYRTERTEGEGVIIDKGGYPKIRSIKKYATKSHKPGRMGGYIDCVVMMHKEVEIDKLLATKSN